MHIIPYLKNKRNRYHPELYIDYAINTQRKLRVAIISPSDETVVMDSTMLIKEENTIPFAIRLTPSLLEDSYYYLLLELWSDNELAAYLLDSAKKEIRVLANPVLSFPKIMVPKVIISPNPTQEILKFSTFPGRLRGSSGRSIFYHGSLTVLRRTQFYNKEISNQCFQSS